MILCGKPGTKQRFYFESEEQIPTGLVQMATPPANDGDVAQADGTWLVDEDEVEINSDATIAKLKGISVKQARSWVRSNVTADSSVVLLLEQIMAMVIWNNKEINRS